MIQLLFDQVCEENEYIQSTFASNMVVETNDLYFRGTEQMHELSLSDLKSYQDWLCKFIGF